MRVSARWTDARVGSQLTACEPTTTTICGREMDFLCFVNSATESAHTIHRVLSQAPICSDFVTVAAIPRRRRVFEPRVTFNLVTHQERAMTTALYYFCLFIYYNWAISSQNVHTMFVIYK